jgi:hypothetical protein
VAANDGLSANSELSAKTPSEERNAKKALRSFGLIFALLHWRSG